MFRYIKINAFEFANHRFNPTYGTYVLERECTKVTLKFIGTCIVEATHTYDTPKEAVLAVSCLRLVLRAREEDFNIIRDLESLMYKGLDKTFNVPEYAAYYHCAETLYSIRNKISKLYKEIHEVIKEDLIKADLLRQDTEKAQRQQKAADAEKEWDTPINRMELD
jgi:hypothetical protein